MNRRSWSNDDSRRPKCAVDDRRQPSDFIVLVRDRQSLVQAFGGDPSRLAGKMVDRRQGPSREDVPAETGERDDQRETQHKDDENFAKLLLEACLRVRPPAQCWRPSDVLVQFPFELLSKLVSDCQIGRRRVGDQHQRQHRHIPGREPNADRRVRPPAAHGSPSRNTNPTPRTV